MSFLTQLDRASHPAVTKLIIHHILGKGNYTLQLYAEMLATLYAEILAKQKLSGKLAILSLVTWLSLH